MGASARNPGGGFLRGADAQEEALARASGLYPCLLKREVQAYYDDNARDQSCVYTDHGITSPAVPVFRNDDGSFLDTPYIVGVVTAPAPNLGAAANRPSAGGLEKIKQMRRRRMARMLTLCAHEGFDALILGAWGCGVFQNDPHEVALEFRELLFRGLRNFFSQVVFAVIDDPTYAIFATAFTSDIVDLAAFRADPHVSHKPDQALCPSTDRHAKGNRKSRRWAKHAVPEDSDG